MSDNGWESVRRDRLVKNELAFRDYNNRRVALEQQAVAIEPDVVDEAVPFLCECGDADCVGALTVTVRRVRVRPRHPEQVHRQARPRLRGRGVHHGAARPLLGGGEAAG